MAYRYTDTNKWNDTWYSNLRPIEKLLFNYLCDNCDCAGFLEINFKKWGSDIGYSQKEIEGALKGLTRGYGIGSGIGNDKESSLVEEKIIKSNTWKNNFIIYQSDLKENYFKIIDSEYLEERKKYHPGLDIKHSIDKAIKDFWNTEAGWKNKKASKSNEIDWKATFNNALSLKCNQVWEQKNKTTIADNTSAIKDAINLLNSK
jgi:hypothetical protein